MLEITDINEDQVEPIAEKKPLKQYDSWSCVGEAVVGMAHRRGDKPSVCQDAYCIGNAERLIMAVCDGAGSSVLSEVGSQQLSQAIVRLVSSLEPMLSLFLDENEDKKTGNKLAEIIYHYSIKLLQDLSLNHKRETKDFRTTLLLLIFGKENAFWFKVGDGEIVIENNNELSCAGKSHKGEYSNETVFIDTNLKIQDVQYGLLDAWDISGAALMSDGCAERLVSIDQTRISGQLSTFFDLQRNDKIKREDLYKFLTNYENWQKTTHDDKTLVIASRKELTE